MGWWSKLKDALTSRANKQAKTQSSRRDKTQTKTSSTSTKTKTNSGRPSSSKSGGSSKGGSTTSRPSYTSPRSGGSTYRRPSTATSRGTVGKSRVGQARRTGSTTTRPKTTVTKALTTSERQSGSTAEEKQKKGMALTVAERTELQNNKPAGTAITKGTVLTQKQRKEAQNRRPKKTAKEQAQDVVNNPKYFKDGKFQISGTGGFVKTDEAKYGDRKLKKKVYSEDTSLKPRSERKLSVDREDKAPDFVDFNPMGKTALNYGIAKNQAEQVVKKQTKKIDKQVKKLEEQGYNVDYEYVKDLKKDIKQSKKAITKEAFEGLEKKRIKDTAKEKVNYDIQNTYKPRNYGKLKSEQLTGEDYLKLQNDSRLGKELGNKALGDELAKKIGARTAYSASKNTISKVTAGVIQGLSYGDTIHGGVGKYDAESRRALKSVIESGAYNAGYAGGQMAGFMLGGTNSLGKSAATTGLRASAKAIAKAEARNAGQQFMRNRAAEMAIETPMNLLDAVKMSRDENGKVDKKQLAMYMSLNTALTGVAGGAMEGIGMAMTRAEGKTYADLLAKSKAGTLTTEGKAQLEKLQNKLVRATEDLYSPKASIANDALGLKTLDKNENKDLIRLTYKGDVSKLTEQESKRLKEITDKSAALEKQNDAIRADLKKSVEIKAQTLNKLSKETGVEYVYTNNDEIVKALRDSGKTVEDDVFVNGVTLTKDGKRKIYINSDSDQAHNIIVGHETTHLLSGTEHFDALKNSVKEYAENLGDYEALRNTFEDVYDSEIKSMSKEEADAFIDEEVTAELVGRYLFGENGEDFVRQLSMKDKNVFQRMYDYIVNAIRNASGDAELRQLNAIKENFDKAYKELGETPESLRAETDGADFSKGYHAGDLGKSEPRSQMSGDRGTGHYGTGTYFVGNKAKISGDYYGKRPVESVDFDKYHLWKPLIDSDAGELHDFLRSVNRYWDKADSKFQTMDDIFNARNEGRKIYDDYYDARSKEGKDLWEEPSQDILNEYGEKYRKFFEDTGTERVYDDIVNDYRTGREFDGNYTSYMIDEMQSQIEDMDSDWYQSLDRIRKSIGDEYSQLTRAERLFNGVSAKDIKKALREVAEEMRLDKTPENVQDSASTRLMKKLGYEGVDVRGTSYDNTQYGSVIYDLKGEDLARKQEIGTARFSKSKPRTWEETKKLDADYKKAVDSGDTETAEKMVREYAKEQLSGSKVRDADGNLVPVYHTAVHDRFNEFDMDKMSPEGDSGAGIYLSSSKADSVENYGSASGPDIENKIERRAEEYLDSGEYENWADALSAATDDIVQGYSEYDTFVNVEKPVYVGKGKNGEPETNLMDDFMDDFESELERSDYDTDDEFEEALMYEREEYFADKVDDIAYEVEDLGYDYEKVREAVQSAFREGYEDGQLSFDDLKKALSDYYLENEEGQTITNEVARRITEKLGYDGIIDYNVPNKFGRMNGIDKDTFHVIAFSPNQVKSMEPVTYDNAGKVIPLSERFNTESNDMRFSIVKKVTDTDGNTHENVVRLDTDLFDGVTNKERPKALRSFVYDHLAGNEFTAYDNNGNPISIEFARYGEKHKKDGAKYTRRTINEMASKPSTRKYAKQLQQAVAQADEIIEVSKLEGSALDNKHQWLDKKGWDYRTFKMADKNGNLFDCTMSIAKTDDGRNILYDVKVNKKIGRLDSSQMEAGPSPIFKDRLAEDADDVKYSKSKRQKKKDAKKAEEYSPEKAADIEGLEAAKSAKASAEEKLTSLKSARDAEAQAGEKLANRQRNVSKFGKQEGKAERLNEIKAKKAESDSKLAQLDKDIESATKELDKAQASIDSYAKNESVKPMGRKEKTAAKVDRLKSEIDGFNTEIKDIRKAITAKNAEIRRLDKVDYGKMSQKEMDAYLAKRNKVVQEVNDMRQNITDLRSRIETRQKEIGETGLIKAQKDALNKPVTPAKRAEAKRAQKQALKEAERKDAVKRGIDVEAYEDAKVPYTDVTKLSDKQIERELNNIKFANKNAKTPAHTEIRNQRKAELVAEKARRKEEGPRYAALRDDQLSDTDPGWTIKRDEEVRRPAGMSTPADAPTAQTPKPTADGNAPKAPKVKPKTGIRAAIDNKTASFRRLFVSSLTGFEDTARSLKDEAMRRELNNAITSVQQINNRVSAFVEKGRTSFNRKQTGISLNEIFDKHHLFKKENQAKLTDFTNYLTYKHAIDRLDVDKPVHLGDNGLSLYTKDDYREMMDAITRDMSDETRKQLDEFETDIRAYFNDLQQYRVDSGQITPEFREYLDKTYPNYVPTYREGDEFLQSELIKSKSKKASVKQSVNVATGGQGEIQDLWSQMVSITHKTIAAGEENNLINVYCKAKGIPTDLVPKDVTLDDAMETAIGVKEVGHGQYRVEFFTNGKPTSVVVDKQIAKGLREINGQEFARLMDAMSHTSGAMRAFKGPITDYNLIFGVKNVGRDTQQAVVNSKDTFWYTKSVPAALSSIANKDSVMRKLYEMNGGYHSSMVLSGKNISMPGSKGGVKGAAKTAFDNTLGRIEEVNNLFEMGPRMCEFIGTLSKHADEQLKANGSSLKQLRNEIEKEMFPGGVKSNEGLAQVEEEFMKRIADMADKDVIDAAARNAADITLNFSRNGVVTKALNMGAVPYMNPAIQGISKTARMFTESNAEGTLIPFLAKLGTITALPAVANEYLCAGNRDYQNLNARDKDANFFIPLGDGRFIKLPKPRENAALVLPVEYGMRWMLEKASIGEVELPAVGKPAIEQGEYGKWKDLGQMFTSGLDLMGPANPLTENIYSPITRLWKNETWYGGAIESTSEVLRKKDGELKNSEIMDESTSALAKWIGQKKIGNTTVSDLTHLSPKKIDNLMDSYLGVIYDMGISQTADAKHGNPILNQFVTDSLFSNKNGTELWAEFDKANAPKDTKGKAIQKGKDIVFGHNQYNISEKSQEAKDWLNLKGYDDITYSDALNKILYDKKLTDAERKKYQRVIKKAQNDLRHDLVYGAKEVKPGMDPIRTIAKLFGVNKAMNKFTYTYTDPETGEKINKHLDAWKAYKQTDEYQKDKAKGGEKFIDFYTKMRWTNGRIGESKAYPSWMTAAVIAATEKGNNKALAGSYIKPPWDKDGTYAQSIIDRGENYKDAGYTQGKYRRSQKAIFNAGRKLGYEYTNQMNPWDMAMALSTNKKHDFSDGAYYAADTSGKVSRRMNYARCLDAKGYTMKQIYKFAKEYDIKLPKTDNMSKEQYVTTMKAFNAKVERAVKDKYGDKPLEEQAAVYHVITDDRYSKPFGDVGDYGKKKDTGITDLDEKPFYSGWGYGGGYGGHGWGGGGWGGGSGGASSGVGAVFGKPKVTDAKAPKSSGNAPKGSISKAKTTKIKMADFSKVSVGDYRTPSNLNDAYRKKAQKLREASRTRKK